MRAPSKHPRRSPIDGSLLFNPAHLATAPKKSLGVQGAKNNAFLSLPAGVFSIDEQSIFGYSISKGLAFPKRPS